MDEQREQEFEESFDCRANAVVLGERWYEQGLNRTIQIATTIERRDERQRKQTRGFVLDNGKTVWKGLQAHRCLAEC